MLAESITLPERFLEFQVGDNTVKILSLVPLYSEELEFKLCNDSHALLSRFADFDIFRNHFIVTNKHMQVVASANNQLGNMVAGRKYNRQFYKARQ